MSAAQNETFTNTQVGIKTFERFAALKRKGALLDTQINVSVLALT